MAIYLQKRKRFLKRLIQLPILATAVYFLVAAINFSLHRLNPMINLFEQDWWLLLITTLIAAVLYKPFDYLILLFFRHFLFKKKLNRLNSLVHSAKTLVHTLDLKELSNLIVNTLSEFLEQRVVILVLFEKNRNRYWIASSCGLPMSDLKKIRFEETKALIHHLKERRGLVQRESCLQEFSWPDAGDISKGFESLGAAAFLSLFADHSWLGFIALSGKAGGQEFLTDEKKTLETFGEQAGYGLRNALVVDELKQTNEKLKDLQAKMLQATKLAAIEQLAAGIAHEIHNPLTIISGKAQILLLKKDKQYDEETLQEALKTIVKQTKRAADITRKLLLFSEPKSSGRELVLFENIIDDTLALISYQTTLDEITIRKNVSKDLPPFRGEINEIREIFLNLILNAVQAVEKKGALSLAVRYLGKEGVIEIKIQDTGKGIRAESIPRLFNPFFTTREGGLGLGLFLTQQIVHRYHGSIHIESEVGRGTVVVIHFPEQNGELHPGERTAERERIHVE